MTTIIFGDVKLGKVSFGIGQSWLDLSYFSYFHVQ